MNILDKIISTKKKEVANKKVIYPVQDLEKSQLFDSSTYSMKEFVTNPDLSGIIAEIKKKSPSKGNINTDIAIERISKGYIKAGASGLSVLTDHTYFGGTNEDLLMARTHNNCPILRKDFIIDEFQIVEAKSIGADVILLIAAVLSPSEVVKLANFAHSLQLEVLLEVHDLKELNDNLTASIDMIGVNNRNLKTFETNTSTSKHLADHIPKEIVKVTESGLSTPAIVNDLKQYGYQGFLIGEAFMKEANPEEACATFIEGLTLPDKLEKP